MNYFQIEMKKRYRIPLAHVEKYKDEIWFMVQIDFTCIEAIIPRVKFIEPMGYEKSEHLIEGYA